jgi:hypothetical protein
MSILDKGWEQVSSFTFNDSTALHGNSRPACPLAPPPMGKYAHCPKMTNNEGIVQSSLYNNALNALVSAGVNCTLLSFAGTSSDVKKYFLDRIDVNTESPTSGKFVVSWKTTHITCFDFSGVARLKSNAKTWLMLLTMYHILSRCFAENHVE